MKLEDLVVTKFDTASDDLVEKMPYVLENTETKERQIGVLKNSDCDMLAFSTWKGVIVINPADAKKYNIYKADLTDGMYLLFKGDSLSISASHDMSEEKKKQIKDAMSEEGVVQMALFDQLFDNVSVLDVNDRPQQTCSIACSRIIDYGNKDTNNALTTGIEYFYTVLAHVTIIRQFLYKINRVKNGDESYAEYSILLPVDEADKQHHLENGWAIHPMFYNKYIDDYAPSVRIQRPMKITSNCDKDDSITFQILSGLQLLHLVEYGINEKDKEEPGVYAGINYVNESILISNAYVDEENKLVLDNEVLDHQVPTVSGYISKFQRWNPPSYWILFARCTTKEPTLSDCYFVGPIAHVKNIIKWGSNESENFGMFNYWMDSTIISEDDSIIPWEFGGE